jgi:intracellular septation protein
MNKPLHPALKLALDVGPLILFFVGNARWGIFAATGVFMAAIVIALIVSYALTRRLPIMALVSAVIVMVFGGLTLVLHDETFIKVKPTIIYSLFAFTLMFGFLFRKPLLEIVFDSMFSLTEEGWRKLTARWMAFFFAMAVLNEIVWRTQTTDVWVSFKLFGAVPLTFVFAALQYPLLMKYEAAPKPEAGAETTPAKDG